MNRLQIDCPLMILEVNLVRIDLKYSYPLCEEKRKKRVSKIQEKIESQIGDKKKSRNNYSHFKIIAHVLIAFGNLIIIVSKYKIMFILVYKKKKNCQFVDYVVVTSLSQLDIRTIYIN